MRALRRLSVLLAIATAVVMVNGSSAYSVPGAAASAVIGGGGIGPGLTATPTPQSGNFSGTATGAGANAAPGVFAGQLNCNFNFSSIIDETVAHGAGNASGNCAGTGVTGSNAQVNCDLVYVRVGPVVVTAGVSCTATLDGNTSTGPLAGGFLFAPTSAPGAPVTSYALAGATAGVGI